MSVSSASVLPTVLVVEDDPILRDRVLVPRLADFGFPVTGIETLRELFQLIATTQQEIVVLDVGLPDGDGFSAARWLRDHFPRIGVVMLTGREGVPDRIRGLQEGADAYLTKPIDPDLLAATLHSVARRLERTVEQPPALPSRWSLDSQAWCLVSPLGQRVPLTRSERKMVVRLMSPSGKIVSREQLIGALTDNVHDFDPHRLDSMIHRVRRKVQNLCGETLPLTAVHGEGYVMTG